MQLIIFVKIQGFLSPPGFFKPTLMHATQCSSQHFFSETIGRACLKDPYNKEIAPSSMMTQKSCFFPADILKNLTFRLRRILLLLFVLMDINYYSGNNPKGKTNGKRWTITSLSLDSKITKQHLLQQVSNLAQQS